MQGMATQSVKGNVISVLIKNAFPGQATKKARLWAAGPSSMKSALPKGP
jgi:hypothetical protein